MRVYAYVTVCVSGYSHVEVYVDTGCPWLLSTLLIEAGSLRWTRSLVTGLALLVSLLRAPSLPSECWDCRQAVTAFLYSTWVLHPVYRTQAWVSSISCTAPSSKPFYFSRQRLSLKPKLPNCSDWLVSSFPGLLLSLPCKHRDCRYEAQNSAFKGGWIWTQVVRLVWQALYQPNHFPGPRDFLNKDFWNRGLLSHVNM